MICLRDIVQVFHVNTELLRGAMGFSSCCQLRGSIIFSGEWLQGSCTHTLHPCFDVFWNFETWSCDLLWTYVDILWWYIMMIYYDIFLIFLAGFQQPVMCFKLLPRWNQTFQERYQTAGPKEGQGVHQPLLMGFQWLSYLGIQIYGQPNAINHHKPS